MFYGTPLPRKLLARDAMFEDGMRCAESDAHVSPGSPCPCVQWHCEQLAFQLRLLASLRAHTLISASHST
jgi:hypothetical protein